VTPELAAAVDTTAICDAAKDTRVMSSALQCRSRNPMICAPAFTVRCRDDFLGVLVAIEQASPGDVVVVDGGGRETALAGELFARTALARGLAGIVVDGGCRDIGYLSTCDLPFYSRHVSPMAGTTNRLAARGEPVSCGGVTVLPGDIVVADREGIVVLDPNTAAERLADAARVKEVEARAVARIAEGATLSDCLNLDEHVDRLARGAASTLRFTV
jgi:regulator of RNase E activity RraA